MMVCLTKPSPAPALASARVETAAVLARATPESRLRPPQPRAGDAGRPATP